MDEKYHLRDPYLTELGEQQCLTLPARFPAQPPVGLLVTSPLKRTIQTTILGFPSQIAANVPVLALPELQETSELPCDTGSDASILAVDPMLKTTSAGDKVTVDLSRLTDDWTSKEGKWAATPGPLKERANWVRKWIRGRSEEHVVCVLHGGFLHYLTEDWTGSNGKHPFSAARIPGISDVCLLDLPGTGWTNTEFRHYVWADEGDKLVETAESRENRADIPLGKTEMRQFIESHLKN